MYWIVAIIRTSSLEAVRERLQDVGCLGLTCSDVAGCGRQGGRKEVYRGAEYKMSLIPKVRLEIACTKGELNLALEAIRGGARTGKEGSLGDGKIFVFGLEDAVRIRTGQDGVYALQ